jgi:hypothetical protein
VSIDRGFSSTTLVPGNPSRRYSHGGSSTSKESLARARPGSEPTTYRIANPTCLCASKYLRVVSWPGCRRVTPFYFVCGCDRHDAGPAGASANLTRARVPSLTGSGAGTLGCSTEGRDTNEVTIFPETGEREGTQGGDDQSDQAQYKSTGTS